MSDKKSNKEIEQLATKWDHTHAMVHFCQGMRPERGVIMRSLVCKLEINLFIIAESVSGQITSLVLGVSRALSRLVIKQAAGSSLRRHCSTRRAVIYCWGCCMVMIAIIMLVNTAAARALPPPSCGSHFISAEWMGTRACSFSADKLPLSRPSSARHPSTGAGSTFQIFA